jgi:hypothetical protein
MLILYCDSGRAQRVEVAIFHYKAQPHCLALQSPYARASPPSYRTLNVVTN